MDRNTELAALAADIAGKVIRISLMENEVHKQRQRADDAEAEVKRLTAKKRPARRATR